MELIPGITKEDYTDYILYYVDNLSNELKTEIRNRLVLICHGAEQAKSSSKIYSYKETLKEFIKRYNTDNPSWTDRKKGLVGELLVHVVLEIEGRFTSASPFFNMEERSFKKGYDIALIDEKTNELWIAEVKSGEKQSGQKNASSAIVGLINAAKNDLNSRLNDSDTTLWLNALNAARVSMRNSSHQKDAVIKLLEQCGDNAADGISSSNTFNVILSGTLFHSVNEHMQASKIGAKYSKIIADGLFKKVFILAIQKSTFKAVYDFLESEVNNEI